MHLNFTQFLIMREINKYEWLEFEDLLGWMEGYECFTPKLTRQGLYAKVLWLRNQKSIGATKTKTIPQRLQLFLTAEGQQRFLQDQKRFLAAFCGKIPAPIEKKFRKTEIPEERDKRDQRDQIDKSEDASLVESVVYRILEAVKIDYDEVSPAQNKRLQATAQNIIRKVQDY